MQYYAGLDVSLKQTSICVVNQTGSVVREGVVDSDPEAIALHGSGYSGALIAELLVELKAAGHYDVILAEAAAAEPLD
jgi:hypothetical protein